MTAKQYVLWLHLFAVSMFRSRNVGNTYCTDATVIGSSFLPLKNKDQWAQKQIFRTVLYNNSVTVKRFLMKLTRIIITPVSHVLLIHIAYKSWKCVSSDIISRWMVSSSSFNRLWNCSQKACVATKSTWQLLHLTFFNVS